LGREQALAACPPVQTTTFVDFELASQIFQQIVAQEPAAPAKKASPLDGADTPYTGPTVGFAKNFGAPTIGYSWALH
jgi:hypothetical protein